MDDLLQHGITAYKAGKRDEARRIFIAVVRQDPDNERAWVWMGSVCNTDQERIQCMEQVLRINPKNEKARQHLDRLLAPPFSSELPVSPVQSVPLDPSPSAVKVRTRKSGFTQIQVAVLAGLAIMLLFLFGAAFLFLFAEKDQAVIAASPTGFVASSASDTPRPTEVLPTATLIPTYAYVATWTPLPSPTSFVVPTLVPPTSKPDQVVANPGAGDPPAANAGSDCSSQLAYAAAMHQYNLDMIDYIHTPMINMIQGWIDEAARDRDALGLVTWQRELDNEKARVTAKKASENQRYEAERGNIKASCQ